MNDLEIGSIVTLKSGGPLMTVEKIDKGKAECIWLHDGKVCRLRVPLECLRVEGAEDAEDEDNTRRFVGFAPEGLTVAELIAELNGLPHDMPVAVTTDYHGMRYPAVPLRYVATARGAQESGFGAGEMVAVLSDN